MAINAYSKKEFENEEYVIYSFGCKYDELTGIISFNKETMEFIIIKRDVVSLSNRILFKIASKM